MGMLGDSIGVQEYECRIRYLMSNFVNKDHAILLSMRNKLGVVVGEEALRETFKKLIQFNKIVAEKKEELMKDRTPVRPDDAADDVELGIIRMTDTATSEHVDYKFKAMARVFGLKALEEEPDYKKQCNQISSLISGEEGSEDNEEDIETTQNYDALLQLVANIIMEVHEEQKIVPKKSFKGFTKKTDSSGATHSGKEPERLGKTLIKNGTAEQCGIVCDDKFGEVSMINQMRAMTPRGTSSGTQLNDGGSVLRPPLTARGVGGGAVLPPRTTTNSSASVMRRASMGSITRPAEDAANRAPLSARGVPSAGTIQRTQSNGSLTRRTSMASITRTSSSGSILSPRSSMAGSFTPRGTSSQQSASRMRVVVKADQNSKGNKTPRRTDSKKMSLPPRAPKQATTTGQAAATTPTSSGRSVPSGSGSGITPRCVAQSVEDRIASALGSSSNSPTNSTGPAAVSESEKF